MHRISFNKRYDFSAFESEIDAFTRRNQNSPNDSALELFYFNPNTIDENGLIKLGINKNTAHNIINYRNKGGKFRKPADFARMYGLGPEQFEKLEPYLVFENSVQSSREQAPQVNYFYFDPNTASEEELMSLGIKKYMAANIVKYRSKGGRFKEPSDLLSIYSFDSACYNNLEPWIKIEANQNKPIENLHIELNTATAEDLIKIKGIGNAYASRIISFREKLGGFAHVEQLREVYGMTEELFTSVKPHVYADASKIDCINLNDCDFKTLISHPYLEKTDVIAILNYRTMVVRINSTEELLKQKVISSETYTRIKDYFCTN